MKWRKYTNFAANNLVVASCLDPLVGPSVFRSQGLHREFTFREWVEQQLEYVAIRPWEKLDMSVTNASDGRLGWNTNVAYTIHYHIEGDEEARARVMWLTDTEGNLRTLSEALSDLAEWYKQRWASKPDRPLVIDAVVQTCSVWHGGTLRPKVTIDIWLAPEGFRP